MTKRNGYAILQSMENPNKLVPKNRAQALRRQVGAVTLTGLALVGGKVAHDAITSEAAPRPTRDVQVEAGDVGVVWDEARTFAKAQNVDTRDVVDDIREASPDYQDGVANPGDVLHVPLTDEEIAAKEQADDQPRG